MKTNGGLRKKKPAMARAAWRLRPRLPFKTATEARYYDGPLPQLSAALNRWHIAAKGGK